MGNIIISDEVAEFDFVEGIEMRIELIAAVRVANAAVIAVEGIDLFEIVAENDFFFLLRIEFDNTVADADHVHSIWHELTGDFGRDLLAEHHARHHAGSALAAASRR